MTLLGVAVLTLGGLVGLFVLRSERDAVAVLSVFVLFLFGISAQWVVKPLGAVGQPANIIAFGCAWLWAAGKSTPQTDLDRDPRPVRTVVLIHTWVFAVGYVIAHLRMLTPLETSGANRAVITLVATAGVALLAVDGITSRDRLDALLQRVVTGSAFMGAVGLVQFFTGFDPTQQLRIPLLGLNSEIIGVGFRSVFNRPYGTALHPIEFGVVLGALLPLALHYAIHRDEDASRSLAWGRVLILATAVPASLSRSGIIALSVGMVVLLSSWDWRQRINGVIVGTAFLTAMWAAIPGLIGTIRSLFLNLDVDPSVQARIDRGPRVFALWGERPWFGRGHGTYSPEDYFLLDNQLYETLIESGVVGVMMIVVLLGVAVGVAAATARRTTNGRSRHLAYAMAAGVLGMAASIPTFDAFFYRVLTGMLFLLIGCIGALSRLERSPVSAPSGSSPVLSDACGTGASTRSA